jgi:hypothetical protein
LILVEIRVTFSLKKSGDRSRIFYSGLSLLWWVLVEQQQRFIVPNRMQLLAIAMARWGLAGDGTADQHGVALLGDEAAAGKVIDQRLG